MYYYHLYGCLLESDLEFPQLVKAQKGSAIVDITFTAGTMPEEILQKEEQQIYYEFGDEFSWLCNKTCRLCVENGKKITYYLKPEGKVNYLQSYLLGFGSSMLFLQRGEMAIHCSALHNGREAILIAGESGSGKSTLANYYLEHGWKLMADDMAVVKYDKEKGAMVYPAFPFQKLCRNVVKEQGYSFDEIIYINEFKDKFLVPYRGEFDITAKPLKTFFMLGVCKSEDILVQEIKSIGKLQICLNNLFLRHLLGQKKYMPKIGQKCLELIAKVDVYVIVRPEEKDTTEEIQKAAFGIVL